VLSTPIRCLRDITDLLQKLVNKEYTRLTGDLPVDAKAVDAENDGDPGSGDEGGKKKKPPNLSRMLKSRLQKLVDKTDDECVSFRIFIGSHVLTSTLQWTGYLCRIHGTPKQENVAWLLQGHQETSMFREHLCTRFPSPTVNIISPFYLRKS